MNYLHWIQEHPTQALSYAIALVTFFTNLYGLFKVSWVKATEKPFPRNKFTVSMDILAEMGVNLIGGLDKAKVGMGGQSIFTPRTPQ